MKSLGKFTLGFGMVVIPVQLYNAVSADRSTELHRVHKEDGGRVQMRRFCSADGKEIEYGETAPGYEAPNGQVVILTEEEVDAAYGEKNRVITLNRVIKAFENPPREAHDATYYVGPLPGGEQAYAILQGALEVTGQAVEVTFALRQRESCGVLYAAGGYLLLERVVYRERVNDIPFEAPQLPDGATPMLEMAQALLGSLPQGPAWADQEDRTAALLTAAVEAKLATGQLSGPVPEQPAVVQPVDLLAALTASVAKQKAERTPDSPPVRTRAAAAPRKRRAA